MHSFTKKENVSRSSICSKPILFRFCTLWQDFLMKFLFTWICTCAVCTSECAVDFVYCKDWEGEKSDVNQILWTETINQSVRLFIEKMAAGMRIIHVSVLCVSHKEINLALFSPPKEDECYDFTRNNLTRMSEFCCHQA